MTRPPLDDAIMRLRAAISFPMTEDDVYLLQYEPDEILISVATILTAAMSGDLTTQVEQNKTET